MASLTSHGKEILIPPKVVCDYCHASRHLTVEEKNRLKMEKHEYRCVLCCASSYSVCESCFIPWKPSYMDEGRIKKEKLGDWMKVKEEDQVVCALCIIDEEYGLDIKDLLASADNEVLLRVMASLKEHGDPPLEIISMEKFTLNIPKVD